MEMLPSRTGQHMQTHVDGLVTSHTRGVPEPPLALRTLESADQPIGTNTSAGVGHCHDHAHPPQQAAKESWPESACPCDLHARAVEWAIHRRLMCAVQWPPHPPSYYCK